MAYLPNQEEDQEQGQQGGIGQQGQPTPAQSVQSLGGQSATLGSGQQNIQRAQTDSPTGFTNINRYLEQNKQQGQQMADKVAGVFQETGEKVSTGINQAQEVFNKDAESQRVDYDPSKFYSGYDIDNRANYQQGLVNQSTGITSSEDRFNEFLKQRDAQYTGYGDLKENTELYNPLYQQVGEAQQLIDQSRTDEGRANLVNTIYNQDNTTRGTGSLDNLLFADEVTRARLDQARTGLEEQKLQDRLEQANLSARQKAEEISGINTATRQAIGEDLGTADTTFKTGLESRLETAKTKAPELYNSIVSKLSDVRSDIKGGVFASIYNNDFKNYEPFTQEEAAAMGMTLEDANSMLSQQRNIYAEGRGMSAGSTIDSGGNVNELLKLTPYYSYDTYKLYGGKGGRDAYEKGRALAIKGRQAAYEAATIGTGFTGDFNAYNLSDYLTYQDPDYANLNSIATADDYAKQSALATLMGTSDLGYITDPYNTFSSYSAGLDPNSVSNLKTYFDDTAKRLEDLRLREIEYRQSYNKLL